MNTHNSAKLLACHLTVSAFAFRAGIRENSYPTLFVFVMEGRDVKPFFQEMGVDDVLCFIRGNNSAH